MIRIRRICITFRSRILISATVLKSSSLSSPPPPSRATLINWTGASSSWMMKSRQRQYLRQLLRAQATRSKRWQVSWLIPSANSVRCSLRWNSCACRWLICKRRSYRQNRKIKCLGLILNRWDTCRATNISKIKWSMLMELRNINLSSIRCQRQWQTAGRKTLSPSQSKRLWRCWMTWWISVCRIDVSD